MNDTQLERKSIKLEEIFLFIESKFNNLDLKIVQKRELVNQIYIQDVEKVKHKYSTNSLHEECLNEHRGCLLNKLNKKQNDLIQEVNENSKYLFDKGADLFRNYDFISKNAKLKFLKSRVLNSITRINLENDLSYYHAGIIPIDAVVLNPFKFSQPFDLVRLNKYSNLIVARKKFLIPKEYLFDLLENTYSDQSKRYHIALPQNKLLVFVRDPNCEFFMLILDTNGKKLYSRRLNWRDFDYEASQARATASKIVIIYRNAQELIDAGEAEEVSYVEVSL